MISHAQRSLNVANRSKPSGYWKNIDNQRAFFDQIAVELRVNKLEDWNSVPVKKVVEKGGSFVKYLYNGSLREGNFDLYYTTN
jgi:hypothetical protein